MVRAEFQRLGAALQRAPLRPRSGGAERWRALWGRLLRLRPRPEATDPAHPEAPSTLAAAPDRREVGEAARPEGAHRTSGLPEIEIADAIEGGELVSTLWRRGIPAGIAESAGRWSVEVRSPREEARTLLAELAIALPPWLAEHGRSAAAVRLGRRRYLVDVHGRVLEADDPATAPQPEALALAGGVEDRR